MGRLLQVVTDTDRRGAQVQATALHAALERRDVNVRTVALAPGAGRHLLKLPVLGPRRRSLSTLRALRGLMQQADVTVGFGSTTLPASVVAGAGTGSRFVYVSIGTLWDWANTPLRRMRVRALLRRAAGVVAHWPDAAAVVSSRFGVPRQRVWSIPTAVDAAGLEPADAATRRAARAHFDLPADRPTLLAVGALSPEKNVEALVQLMAEVDAYELLVVGDGPQRPALEALAARAAPGRIRFTGVLADPRPAYEAADVMVLASRTEGVPAVLIEAALCGLPIVATAVGGVPQVVQDGRTGVLLQIDATARQWRNAIEAARGRAGEFGADGRRHALATFEAGVVAERWCRLFADLAQE